MKIIIKYLAKIANRLVYYIKKHAFTSKFLTILLTFCENSNFNSFFLLN